MSSIMLKTAATALMAAALLALPQAAAGQGIILYAYAYTDSLDIALEPIGTNLLGWLTGLDYPGEWVEYDLEPQVYGTYEIRLAVRGAENIQYHLEMAVTDVLTGDEQVIPFDFIGLGFGSCSCNILSVGGDQIGLYNPLYSVRLTTSTVGELWVYSFSLPVLTGTEPSTWGRVKSLFRE